MKSKIYILLMKISAVISGDLIRSRQANETQITSAFDTLSRTATALQDITGNPLKFTRFRGDGWQVHLSNPGAALTCCLIFHAHLRAAGLKIDSRIAVGIGPITSTGSTTLSDAAGFAFIASGKALDKIGKRLIVVDGQNIGPDQQALFHLAEHIIFGWTANQAEAAAIALKNKDFRQEDIANQLGITRQAVQMRLASAGLSALESACNAFQQHDFDSKGAR